MVSLDKELNMEFKNEHQKLFLNLLFTSNWLRHMDMERLRPSGLSPQQYNILRILRGAKGQMNMHQVKERMIDRAPNATRLTDKLIAKGLVERERCEEDRRVVFVRISAKGLELLSTLDKKTEALQIKSERITESEAQTLNRLLDAWRG